MMAFGGHQNKFPKSLIPTYKHQATVDVSGGHSGNKTWPFLSVPSVSLNNQETTSYVPWSHNSHGDPYELTSCLQSSNINRKATDSSDYEGETHVSNILDGANSQDSYTDGGLPTCNLFWSPKKPSEELLQFSQHNLNFSSNYVYREAFSKAQGQSADKELLLNLANGDRERHIQHGQKVPPGLEVPKVGDNYMSQIQQSSCDSSSADEDRGKSLSVNNFTDLSDVFRRQSCFFDPYYEDKYIQNGARSISNEQYVPQNINQQVSSFQSLKAGKYGCFPSTHKQTFGVSHEDRLVELWKFNGPAASTRSSPTIQSQKHLGEDVGIMQRGRNGGVRKQILKRDAFQDHLLEDRQQPQPFSLSVNLPNQYQNKMSMPRESINMNQDVRHHILQSQIQNKVKPQMKKENSIVHLSGFVGEEVLKRSLNNSHMKVGVKKGGTKVFSRSPHFGLQGEVQSLRFDGENDIVSSGNTHLMYPVGDLSVPNNFSFRPSLFYGSGVPHADLRDRSTVNASAVFNSHVREMMRNRGENTNHGRASSVMTSVVQLYCVCVDDCFEQWKCLEKERKRTEVVLSKAFVGKRITAVANVPHCRSPPNPVRTDHLLVKQMREQAKVASLLNWMECLRNSPLPVNIGNALKKHSMVINFIQARREEEAANMSRHLQQQQRVHVSEDRDSLMMFELKDLVALTRKLRAALWCALQMTLPKPDKKQENHGNKEATCREDCTSPFTGYSFK